MGKRGIVSITNEIGDKIAGTLDYDLVDVEFVKDHGNYFLRVYIDKEGGVSLEDCQRMSEELSFELDKQDPIDIPYYLEVSSPGLDRPLKNDKDFDRNLGKEVEIRLYKAMDNRKRLEGVLNKYDDNNFYVEIENEGVLDIPRELVSLIRLVIKF